MNEVKSEDKVKESLAEPKIEGIDQMSAFKSGDQQNRSDLSNVSYVPDYNWQANNQNLTHFEENDGKGFNYGEYYNYYTNYYQQLNANNNSNEISQNIETNTKERTIDLINKALAKQQLKASTDTRDDDEEEGQIPASPGIFNRSVSRTPPDNSSRNSPFNTSHRSISRSHSRERSIRSHSRSRKRHISRSRSRSTSRRRRRSRSRSRSPYFGPIIKDYRRGRRGFVRYPRGFRDRGQRPFRRGQHSNYNYYGVSRRHEYSRSKSRSHSPKRRHIEVERNEMNSDDDKTMDSKHSETLKPSDINLSEKRLTQSFLAMLEEKQNRAKMIPLVHNNDNIDNDPNRAHGFVNTFNSIRQMDRKHTLSYDLEREGWQVIDDANTDSRHNRNSKSTEHDYYDERRHSESLASLPVEKVTQKTKELESGFSDYENKKKKKKSKNKKKKKKRKVSSSDSSESDSDNDNVDQIETKPKKRSKKKKKKSKKRKRKVSSSSSSSEKEEIIKKHKKKKKKKDSSSESETSEEKPKDIVSSITNIQTLESNDLLENSSLVTNEVINEVLKTKDKKKRKSSESIDSSDSDSDVDNKKRKKKKKRKTSKKRKHRSSSSSSSDSSDSSESGDRKKKKKRKSKKTKSKKHKKRSEKREKSKSIDEDKKKMKEEVEDSEFVSVMSVGEPPLEMKWPKNMIKYTICLPSLQYSINPKVTPNLDDFRNDLQIRNISEFEAIRRIESSVGKDSHELSTEYEKFMGELNPVQQSDAITENPHSLESELRDKLVKQLYDRNESQKQDLMTSSERRALERNKKQSYSSNHSYDGNDHKRHEDLKSATLSAYYSPKVPKCSPNQKSSENLENSELKNNRNPESDHYYKIRLNTDENKEDSSHKQDSKTNDSKTDDKKITAKELLERVKQRKHSDKDSKESVNRDKSETKSSKKLPQIGKLKTLSKKSVFKKSVTTANADSTQNTFASQPMKLDMNYDYNWYYNYYMNSVYGIGQYPQLNDPALASAYYAQYSMLTSYDYSQTDLNSWVTQRGYSLEDNSGVTQTQTEDKSSEQILESSVKTVSEGVQPSVESSASDLNKDIQTINAGLVSNGGQTLQNDSNNISGQKNIEVLVFDNYSNIPLEESKELKDESQKVKVSPGLLNQIESTDIDGNSESSSPPPPPPPRPVMTALTSNEPITLPNGQVLPAGTKQIVVHPYQTGDPYKFTADWFNEAFNSQNTTQTNS